MKGIIINTKIDEKNKIVIATAAIQEDGYVLAKAKARCHTEDDFDAEFGEQLAKRRVLIKALKREISSVEGSARLAKKHFEECTTQAEKAKVELKKHEAAIVRICSEKYPQKGE